MRQQEIKPTLLILAAGMGSRYGGLKQMDGVGPSGEAIIDYSISDAIRAGFGKIVFVIRQHFEDEFSRLYTDRLKGKIPATYVQQELHMIPEGYAVPSDREKPWGTAHAILVARNLIKEPFAVINADDFYGTDSFALLHKFLIGYDSRADNHHCLIGYELNNTLSEHGAVSRGVCEVDAKGLLSGIHERKGVERTASGIVYKAEDKVGELTGNEVVSMNMWGFHPSIFDRIHECFCEFLDKKMTDLTSECYIPDFIESMITAGTGRVEIVPSSDSWFGVTYKEDRPIVVERLERLVESGVYSPNLWG